MRLYSGSYLDLGLHPGAKVGLGRSVGKHSEPLRFGVSSVRLVTLPAIGVRPCLLMIRPVSLQSNEGRCGRVQQARDPSENRSFGDPLTGIRSYKRRRHLPSR